MYPLDASLGTECFQCPVKKKFLANKSVGTKVMPRTRIERVTFSYQSRDILDHVPTSETRYHYANEAYFAIFYGIIR